MKSKVSKFGILIAALLAIAAKGVEFEWDHSPDPLVVNYRLYWGTSAGTYTASRATTTRTNAINVGNTNFLVNVPYFFVVTAGNAVGIESVPSNEVRWTNIVRPMPPGTLRVRVVVDVTTSTNGTATSTTTVSTVNP